MGPTRMYQSGMELDRAILDFLMGYMGGTPLDFLYSQEDPYEGIKKEDIIEVTDFVVLDDVKEGNENGLPKEIV